MEKAPWWILLALGLWAVFEVFRDEKNNNGKISAPSKIIIALIVFLLILLFLPGCYLLPKDQVGLASGGITVMNNSKYDLMIFENGGGKSTLIQPGEHMNISIKREYENTSETIRVMAKAYATGKYIGCAERGLTVTHHYSETKMEYRNNLPLSWIVGNYEIRK